MRSRGRLKAVLLFFLLLVFSGCAGTPDALLNRSSKELYDTGLEAYLGGRFEEAEKSFKALLEDHPLSPYSIEADLMLGDVSYASEQYEDASLYYANFVALHPAHPKAPYALFQKGMSHFKDILDADRDQTSTKKALFAFEDLVSAYPGSPYAGTSMEMVFFIKKRLAEKEFYIADFYFKKKNYKGALGRLRDILRAYPDAGMTDKALYYIGESYSGIGEKGLAEEAFSTLITNYPGSPYANGAKDRLRGG